MRVLMLGAGAQARLSHVILRALGHTVPHLFDRDSSIALPWDCELFHDESEIPLVAAECDAFLVAISGIYQGETRIRLARRMERLLSPISAIHSTAYMAVTASIGKGLQTYPRAVVNEGAKIGDYCVLGTNSSVDHDCRIGNGVNIMGAVALAGEVCVGDHSSICTNATVLPGVEIGANSIVGAGAVVTKNVPDNVVVVGVPARVLKVRP
jgi:UDP-perosamine 4-acetyltransferase